MHIFLSWEGEGSKYSTVMQPSTEAVAYPVVRVKIRGQTQGRKRREGNKRKGKKERQGAMLQNYPEKW